MKRTKISSKMVEKEVEIEISYVCPVRGLVVEKVKGVKLKTVETVQQDSDELVKLVISKDD